MTEVRTQVCLKCGWEWTYTHCKVEHCMKCGDKLGVEYVLTSAPMGWQCPLCLRGVSPHVEVCPCHQKDGSPVQGWRFPEGSTHGEPIF